MESWMWWALGISWLPVGYVGSRLLVVLIRFMNFMSEREGEQKTISGVNTGEDVFFFFVGIALGYITLGFFLFFGAIIALTWPGLGLIVLVGIIEERTHFFSNLGHKVNKFARKFAK